MCLRRCRGRAHLHVRNCRCNRKVARHNARIERQAKAGARKVGMAADPKVAAIKAATGPLATDLKMPFKGPGLKPKPRAGRTTFGQIAAAVEKVFPAPGVEAPAKGKAPVVEPTNPKLLRLVKAHVEKNKSRNGWDKVLTWGEEKLVALLAGAKTDKVAIKRTRAAIEVA